VTIIHSSTTETVRLPAEGGGSGGGGGGGGDAPTVTVHPAAVRSKLPLKKRVREKRHNNNNNNNNSPAKKNGKKPAVTAAAAAAEEGGGSTADTCSPKKLAQKKKERNGGKTAAARRKKSKDVIDYSAVQQQQQPSGKKTPEDDPLGKVRNWLLNSHHADAPAAVRKSKSSPAGLANAAEPPAARPMAAAHAPKAARPPKTKDNQVSLQVVYKPPFKFSVKLSKSKPDLQQQQTTAGAARDKRPDRIKQRAALLIRANRAHGGVKPPKKNRGAAARPQEPKNDDGGGGGGKDEPIYENAAVDLLRMSSTEHDGHQPIFPVAATPPADRRQRASYAGADDATPAAGRSKRNSAPQQQSLQPPRPAASTAVNLMRFPSTENKADCAGPPQPSACKSDKDERENDGNA